MTDVETGWPARTSVRLAWLIVTWLILSSALVAYVYTLWWFSPAITNPGGCDRGSWWRTHDESVLWVVALLSIGAAWVLFGVALSRWRSRSSGRWWPWPLAAIACAAAGLPALTAISAAAWCPML